MNILTKLVERIPPVLFHFGGPFSIHAYGLFIVIGLIAFFFLINRDSMGKSIISSDQLYQAVIFSTIIGFIGCRLLFVVLEWRELNSLLEIFFFWQGGGSVLGALITVPLFLIFYFSYHQLSVMRLLDLGAFYAPILHGISRFGCFFAGCCHGISCARAWAVIYTNSYSCAPLYRPLHPTQLYSALFFFVIFLMMMLCRYTMRYVPGQYLMLYLMLSGVERFVTDFWRGDRVFLLSTTWSIYQLIALVFIVLGLCGLISTRLIRDMREHI